MQDLACPNPYEKYGESFEYGVLMECDNFEIGGKCVLSCNGTPSVSEINCVCDKNGNCDWDRRKLMKKRVRCLNADHKKYAKMLKKYRNRAGNANWWTV